MKFNGHCLLQDVKTQRFSTTGWLTLVRYDIVIFIRYPLLIKYCIYEEYISIRF